MRLRQLFDQLYEAPIEDYQLIGDFSKRQSFHMPQDRRLVSNPRYIERIKSMFANTEFDFRMYFVNSKEALIGHADVAEPGQYQQRAPIVEEGEVTLQWLQQKMPQGLAQIQQQGGFNPEGINMIFTNNRGDQGKPMTGWIIAHRIGHSVLRPRRDGKNVYNTIQRELQEQIRQIFQMYGVKLPQSVTNRGWGGSQENFDAAPVRRFLAQLGTFKSARDNNLRNFSEFIYECFAQYLIKGAITLNPPPVQMITGFAWGRPSYSRRLGQPEQAEANYAVQAIEGMSQQEFERALHAARGKIFVM